jgi:predicted enzyme related to lactoylglutathione lyase
MTTTEQHADVATGQGEQAEPQDNTVTWWEIQVPDLEAAQAFYGAAFGWTFQEFYDGFLMCLAPDGSMIGGLEQSEGSVGDRQVRIYVQTSDLEATLQRGVAAGGTVVKPRALISDEFGWYAILTDPSGHQIGVATSRPAPESS